MIKPVIRVFQRAAPVAQPPYRTAARGIRMPIEGATGRKLDGIIKTFTSLLRLTERDWRAALASGLALFIGPRRKIRNGRIKGRLSAEEVR